MDGTVGEVLNVSFSGADRLRGVSYARRAVYSIFSRKMGTVHADVYRNCEFLANIDACVATIIHLVPEAAKCFVQTIIVLS